MSRLSQASLTSSSRHEMICHVSNYTVVVAIVGAEVRGGMMWGDLPVFRWKGENPVEKFTVFIIAK